ncbi:O-antigen ligase family protein [Edaphobacter bradus]|uniref:O-antigen ligase family protein n=1 Tax=Edaphobacter bradus TaxID=2259016 RepID=UPI0021DF8698|nr:O-antigen ligase family protein [Edaphobacter bradus]
MGLLLAAVLATACTLGLMVASDNWIVVAAICGLLLLLARPIEVALGLYAFLIPFESMTTIDNSDGPTPTLLRYVGLVALLATVGAGWLSERITRPPKTALFWSLFILWCAVSTLWAIDPEMALHRLPTVLGLWLLYMAVVSVRMTAKELAWITLLTILGGCSASVYSAYMFFQAGDAVGRASLGEGSTLSDPNFFAIALLLPLSLAVSEVLTSRTWSRRVFVLSGTGVIALAVFLTMSRGALAAVAAIAFVFLFRLRLDRRLLLPVVATGGALLFMPALFFERMHEASASRISGRQDIWLIGIHSLKSYGAFGAGLDNFPNAFERYAGTSLFFAGDQRSSHNIYLTASVELGVVGILFLFAALRSHMKAFRPLTRMSPASANIVAFEAACWGMLIAGFTLDILWRKAFWFVWALSVVAIQVVQQNKQRIDTDSLEMQKSYPRRARFN